MGFRFRKGLSLLPGVRLNFSKSGASLSLGGRGMSVNLSPSGVRTTVGVPGSGMSYRSPTYQWSKLAGGATKATPARVAPKPAGVKWERLKPVLPDPRRYPQTDEECQRLMTEQPFNWEWLLAYRLMSLRFAVLKEDWENVTWEREQPRHPRGARDLVKWSQRQVSHLQQIVQRISVTGTEKKVVEAFGPPGVKGNPDKIVAWVDTLCGDLAACVDWERETQTLRWYPEGDELFRAMVGWSLTIVKPFFEMLSSLEKQLPLVEQTKRLELYIKIDGFEGDKAVAVLRKMQNHILIPFPEAGEARVDTGGPGGFEPPRIDLGGGGGSGGGGDDGPKVFFDDGQVRVTENLVTIGPPWNKAFAVSEIRSVRTGENEGNKLQKTFLQGMGWLFLGGGALLGAVGFWIGTVFCGITGLSLLLTQPAKDGPFGVTISMGGFWESEYLSTANSDWAAAVGGAIQEAMNYSRQPRSGGSGGEFIYLDQDHLRN